MSRWKRITIWLAVGLLTLMVMGAVGLPVARADAAPKPDPNGSLTGAINDVPAAKLGDPTPAEIGAAVGHNRVAINFMWTLITGFLVMFMQAGFAMVETGLTRAKNAAHTMTMNMMIYPLGMLGFYVCGFALMFGGLGGIGTMGGYSGLNNEFTINLFGKPFGLFGTKGFFLSGLNAGGSYDVAVFTLFLFQMVFMDTTATIPTGALAVEVLRVLSLWVFHRQCHVPVLRQLGLGRRLAGATRSQFRSGSRTRGFRGLIGGAHAGRRYRFDRSLAGRASLRQI
jgi:hypothetical protein